MTTDHLPVIPRIERILYCTAMGPNAAYVFRYAYAMARGFGARITVLHVLERLNARQRAMVEGYSGTTSLDRLVENAEKEAAEQLPTHIETFCRKAAAEDDWHQIVDTIVVDLGHVNERILEHVKSSGADLLVIGAHRESPRFRAIIGSSARALTQRSPVPVLTVQVPQAKQDPLGLEFP